MWPYPKLSTLIRRAHRGNPDASPQQIAAELKTTPKYVSKILRRAKVKKFKTGPKPRQADTTIVKSKNAELYRKQIEEGKQQRR